MEPNKKKLQGGKNLPGLKHTSYRTLSKNALQFRFSKSDTAECHITVHKTLTERHAKQFLKLGPLWSLVSRCQHLRPQHCPAVTLGGAILAADRLKVSWEEEADGHPHLASAPPGRSVTHLTLAPLTWGLGSASRPGTLPAPSPDPAPGPSQPPRQAPRPS